MKVEKKVLLNLTKCYSVAPLRYKGKEHILVASEKVDRCVLFDTEGNLEETIWEEPGGVMNMVQVPGTDGQFLATHQFYSPNDSGEARIIIVTPKDGIWERRILVKLPFVHRFDILRRNGINYLVACTIKSGHEYKEDWSSPGKIYTAVLPEELDSYGEEQQLELTVLKDGLLKNHGYYRADEGGVPKAIISSENGIYQLTPPKAAGDGWELEELAKVAASDAVLFDLDGDGEKELAVMAPFHGDNFSIYKKSRGEFEKVYEYPEKTEFLHAVFGGELCKKPQIVLGYRKGDRSLLAFSYDDKEKTYRAERLDTDCGPANVLHYVKDGKDVIISTNREIDEIAMYTITE